VPEPDPVVDRGGTAVVGVEHAAKALGVRTPATRAGAALDEAVDRVWEMADARQVTPVGRGAPQHGVWEAIRSRAGRRSVSCCEPIGEPCGR
jgi:hypothetical protein